MAAGLIGGPSQALGSIGDIVGLIGGLSQQGSYNKEMQGLSGNLNQILGMEGGAGSSLLSSYMNKVLPALQQMVSTLGPEQQQAQQGAESAFGNVGNAANALMNPGSTPDIAKMGQVANQLQHWSGLGNKEMNALQLQAGNAALSSANTMKQQMGGVANPALLMQQLANQAGQTGQGAAVQLGSLAQQQQLGAREDAGSIYNQMTQDQISKLTGAGGLYDAQGQGMAGISSQDLNGVLNSLSQQGQAGMMGEGMLGQVGQEYGGLFGMMAGSPEASANPWGSFFSNLAGIIPSQWGGSSNSGSGIPPGGWSFGQMPTGPGW